MPPRGLTPLAEAIYAKDDVAPLITDETKDEADAVRVPHQPEAEAHVASAPRLVGAAAARATLPRPTIATPRAYGAHHCIAVRAHAAVLRVPGRQPARRQSASANGRLRSLSQRLRPFCCGCGADRGARRSVCRRRWPKREPT